MTAKNFTVLMPVNSVNAIFKSSETEIGRQEEENGKRRGLNS